MTSPAQRPPSIDPIAAERWHRRAAPASPWLHEEVARRMLERLQWIKLKPSTWAHWEPVRGGLAGHAALAEHYAGTSCFVIETVPGRAALAQQQLAKPWWRPGRWTGAQPRLAMPEPGSLDMLWANMALHNAADPEALLHGWHRLLGVNGFLMFSCLGPDTARELRELYEALGWPPAGHQLTDMHDWGDMLVHIGFAEPVMDMERITLTYESPARLLQELTELGRNLHPARFGSLRGRGWKARLEALLRERLPVQADGRIALTFEVIYGHAIKPLPKVKVSALSSVSVQDMRSMLQGQRSKS